MKKGFLLLEIVVAISLFLLFFTFASFALQNAYRHFHTQAHENALLLAASNALEQVQAGIANLPGVEYSYYAPGIQKAEIKLSGTKKLELLIP